MANETVSLDRIIENTQQYRVNLGVWYALAKQHTSYDMLAFGRQWYSFANNAAAFGGHFLNPTGRRSFEYTKRFAGIIGVISPGVGWHKNMIDAHSIVTMGEDAIISTYGRKNNPELSNKSKAIRIAKTGDIENNVKGDKVFPFYWTILYPLLFIDDPVIDRHMIRTIVQSPLERPLLAREYAPYLSTPAKRFFFRDLTVQFAKSLSEKPSSFQAIVWTMYRTYHGLAKADDSLIVSRKRHPMIAHWRKLIGYQG